MKAHYSLIAGLLPVLYIALFGGDALAQKYLEEATKAEVTQMNAEVNKRYWLAPPNMPLAMCGSNTDPCKRVELCPSATGRFDQCERITEGSFIVESIALEGGYPPDKPVIFTNKFYFVKFDDGKSGFIPQMYRYKFLAENPKITREKKHASQKAAKEECARRGEPQIGMTREQTSATCWGQPLRTLKTKTAEHLREKLLYGVARYLEFEDGVLIAIHEAN